MTTFVDEAAMRGSQGQGQPSQPQRQQQQQHPSQWQRVNVGEGERAVSLAAGAILALQGLSRRSTPGLLMGLVGGAMVYRGVTGHCHAYQAMGLDTAKEGSSEDDIAENGIHIAQSFLINRSAEELFQFWRDFHNLPRIMTHLERVDVIDDRRSHWVVKAPRIAGGIVQWDAEITREEPNQLIAWRSMPGSEVDTAGEIRFERAMGDRGTMAHVSMDYVPPAGRLGHFIAAMLGENPKRVVREDLRNFKRLMEVGEILTIIGQPQGTCTGEGKRNAESDWRPLFM